MTSVRLSTYSIVAADLGVGEWGVAVQSKFLAVGSVVPWARAGVGAIATQALANVSYGYRGLELLTSGHGAGEAAAVLVAVDPEADRTQLGIVDAAGQAAAHTGAACHDWAGHLIGDGFCCQGNILAGPRVVEDMAAAFVRSRGDLADRMVTALTAGQAAGGDRRGQQSAALLVVRAGGGYGGYTDRYLDLRVDDHCQPVSELGRLIELWRLYFQSVSPADMLPLDEALATELARCLRRLGYDPGSDPRPGDPALAAAWRDFCHTENFEERLGDGIAVDPAVLQYLRHRATDTG